MGENADELFGTRLAVARREEYDRAVQAAGERQIVVATDGSESADNAVSAACKLAKALAARAVLVYVRPPVGALGQPYYQERLSEEMEHARVALDRAKGIAQYEGVESEEEILEGQPADEIVGLAQARDALLIVVGSRGLGAVAAALIGSVSSAVLHRADRPVVVVPVHD
jgi:nucleotide-binding universal stress UspA family protein